MPYAGDPGAPAGAPPMPPGGPGAAPGGPEPTPEELAEVGVESIAVGTRTEDEETFGTLSAANFDENKSVIWVSSQTLGDFGMVKTTPDTPDECECDVDETCSEECICDPHCEDPTDATDPTGGTDPSDTSDASDPVGPIECEASEFACADGQQCIDQSNFCNGLPQCNDGSDETDPACGGGGGAVVPPDEYEPDNTFAEATEMSSGDTHGHSLPIGDEDYIVFYIDRRLDVTIETSGGSGDTELYLYTENYSQITFDDQGGINSFSKITQVLEAGVYFAKVKAGGWSAADIYTYNLSLTSAEPLEPGPTNLVATMDGQVVNLSWTAAAAAATYNVYYGQTPGGPYTGSPSEANEGVSPVNTDGLTQALTGLSQNNTFYIIVTGVDAAGLETYPSTEVSVTIPLVSDAFEPDDSFETAQLIEPGVQQEHSCHIADDQDYVYFELTAWKNDVKVETSGPQSADTKLYLYDSTFTQIGYNDDGGGSLFSLIEMSELPAGIYYAMARPFGSFSTYGAYWIDLTVVETDPPSTTPDAFEEDNTIETATELTADEAQTRSIHQDGDVDFVQFTLEAVSDIVLSTTGESGDTILTIMDAEQNELGKDDTADALSSIELSSLEPGTYYARVTSQAIPQLLETYELELTVYAHPAAPENIVATPGPGTITLSWDAADYATSYIIAYEYSDEAPFETVSADEGASPLTTTEMSFVFTGLPSDAPTYFCITSVNGPAQSACSDLIGGTAGEAVAEDDDTGN